MFSYIKDILRWVRNYCVSCKSLMKLVSLKNDRNQCLLISNGSTLSGAPLVLLEAAKVLKKNGLHPVILTEYTGPIIAEAKKKGCEIIVIPSLKNQAKKVLTRLSFRFVIVNTIVNYDWIRFFGNTETQIIWWLHEGKTYINNVRSNLPRELPGNVHVFCVSSWTAKAIAEEGLNYSCEILNYGCSDIAIQPNTMRTNKGKDKFKIAIIGNICERKNQTEFIEIFNSLSEETRAKYYISIVGKPLSYDDKYYKDFLTAIKNVEKDMCHIEEVSRTEISKLYYDTDIVLCCSLDDPLPVVLTEGMMFGKIIISSSCTGHTDYIENGVNGFMYDISKPSELVDILEAVANGKFDLDMIGKNARLTYEKYFTLDSFAYKLNEVVGRIS